MSYSHSVVTPVIVAPGRNRVVPLQPEFVTPQDGHDKQDSEHAAAKRWMNRCAAHDRAHVQALTCYLYFESFEALLDFMMRGLELYQQALP